MKKVLVGFGTRPEAIKMAPLILALQKSDEFEPFVVTTGQHLEMLDQVLDVFGIQVDMRLSLERTSADLASLNAKLIELSSSVLTEVSPDVVCVQGDTATTFAMALAAFFHKTKLVHLEAGLRTSNKFSPFPEEINRRLTTVLADLHLAATELAAQNLIREGVDAQDIVITGNTVIDALLDVVSRQLPYETTDVPTIVNSGRSFVLVTMHRRESWGDPMRVVSQAIGELARRYPDLDFVMPLHPNQVVQDAMRSGIVGLSNVIVIDPVPYSDFCLLMKASKIILTDSGGIQEEAPSLGVPVLVARDTTERPEAIYAGTAKLVGLERSVIVASVSELLDDDLRYLRVAQIANPFGDGRAAVRSVDSLRYLFSLDKKPDNFEAISTRQYFHTSTH